MNEIVKKNVGMYLCVVKGFSLTRCSVDFTLSTPCRRQRPPTASIRSHRRTAYALSFARHHLKSGKGMLEQVYIR